MDTLFHFILHVIVVKHLALEDQDCLEQAQTTRQKFEEVVLTNWQQ